jgi:ribosomal protein S12 methylthiotransferase
LLGNVTTEKVSVVSLGCPKNDSDTEVMLGILGSHGFEFVSEPEDAQVLLINTCAFIKPAVEESLGFLQEALEQKRSNPDIKIVVTGCLPQRWRLAGEEVPPEIDCVLGVGEYQDILEALRRVSDGRRIIRIGGEPRFMPTEATPRVRITPPHYAYVKIADGCDNRCSYCLIPSLRGRYRSRNVEDIVSEARVAAETGAKEIILVGQDTTNFGSDRGGPDSLATLLSALSGIDGLEWIRVLYTYPAHFSDNLIGTIRDLPNVLPYLDIPLQHSHDDMLARMNRRGTNAGIVRLMDELRESIDDVAIRTTFIIGFPGESEEHFEHLLDFIERMCFDRVGIFAYSAEKGTRAAEFVDQVPGEVRDARRDTAMELQRGISLANNKGLIGKKLRVLIESESPGNVGVAVGRTYRDAPEIDGCIFVEGCSPVAAGTMVDVEVTGAQEYDLMGKKVDRA